MPVTTTPRKAPSVLKRWLLFFLLICTCALIWSMPASLLPRLLAASNAGNVVLVSGTHGTLWSGRADQVHILSSQPGVLLEQVNWRFNWRSLLDARLCLEIASAPGTPATGISFEGQSCFFADGAIHLNELLFELPAALLVSAQLRNSPLMRTLNSAVRVEGDISGLINRLVWQRGQLQQLQAQGLWSDAAIAMQLPDAQTFRMRQQQLRLDVLPWTAEVRNPDQVFLHVRSADLAPGGRADLQVDSQSDVWLDGRYTTQLQLGVLPTTPAFLRDILTIVAQPQGSGVYRLEWRSTGV